MSQKKIDPQQSSLRLGVFCGAQKGTCKQTILFVEQIGVLLAKKGITLVYGGGESGLMGALANCVLRENGKIFSIGCDDIPEVPRIFLPQDNEKTPCISSRKQRMITLSDGFLVLPGGFGTLDELFEVLAQQQLTHDRHKNIMLVNINGFWDGLLNQLEGMVINGFLSEKDRARLTVLHSLKELEAILQKIL